VHCCGANDTAIVHIISAGTLSTAEAGVSESYSAEGSGRIALDLETYEVSSIDRTRNLAQGFFTSGSSYTLSDGVLFGLCNDMRVLACNVTVDFECRIRADSALRTNNSHHCRACRLARISVQLLKSAPSAVGRGGLTVQILLV
jgi:hypothetical protein